MKRKMQVLVSILLIISGIVIHLLSDRTDGTVDLELVGFIAGFVFGVGVLLLIQAIFKELWSSAPRNL